MDNKNSLVTVNENQVRVDPSWVPALNTLAVGLHDMAKETENDFLALGASLQDFSLSCMDNACQANSIVDLITCGTGFNVNSFKDLFESVYQEIEAITQTITDGLSGIEELMSSLDTVLSMETFLKKLSRSITIIGTLIRIETARGNHADFNVMTGIIDGLALQILDGTKKIVASSQDAIDKVAGIHDTMAPWIQISNSELVMVKGRVEEVMSELEEMSKQARWLCERISGRISQITPAIGEVVTAIQYHDITRQQLEHVGEALVDIVKKFDGFPSEDEHGRIVLLKWTVEVMKIQQAQLSQVVTQTNKAAEGIMKHLNRVSDLSEAQAEDAGTILEEEETGKNRIQLAGSALDSLTSILFAINNMTSGMLRSIEDAGKYLEGMNEQVANIEAISENINLLALNAIVKAARAGEEGRSLEVLALEINKLSANAKEKILEGSSAINRIIATSSQFRETLQARMQSQMASSERISREARGAIEKLIEQDGDLMKSMSCISDKTRALEEDINSVISRLNFHIIIEDRVAKATGELEALLADVTAMVPEYAMNHEDFTPDLKELLARYTMQSERAIHEAISLSASVDDDMLLWGDEPSGHNGDDPAVQGEADAQGGGDDDLGDNVDLF